MTLQSNASMADMLAMRQGGASIADIGRRAGLKPMTAYQRLRREYGVEALAPLPGPANDNNPERVTRMTPRNGGCSTTSGMMPVTVRRLAAANDNAEDEVMAAGLAVHEYALQVAA